MTFFGNSTASAQEHGRVVKMTVSPAPKSDVPVPYPLLPHLRDMKPGNAAVFYQRSHSPEWWHESQRKEVVRAAESLEKPYDPVAASQMHVISERFGPLKEIDYAARLESCDWQLVDRIRSDGFNLLIPDVQSLRTVGVLNAARIRSAVHRGRFDQAARGLQTQFVMAKHVGETPCLIFCLVGNSLLETAKEPLEEWAQQPDAPSLFWALTDLPNPAIDWRRAFDGEGLSMDSMFPEIRRALEEGKPQPVAASLLEGVFDKFAVLRLIPYNGPSWKYSYIYAIAQAEPTARAYFAKKGLTAAEIDRLPVTQLVLMYLIAEYERDRVQYAILQNLPYWQARPFLARQHTAMLERKNSPFLLSFSDLWPGWEKVFRTRPRVERTFALLRHIEALRLYAGEHAGQWPDALEDMRPLPLPVDPFTGKAFRYRREGDVAILEAEAPFGISPSESNAVRYELTLRKSDGSK